MKNAHCLAATVLVSAVFLASAKADDPAAPTTPSTSDILSLHDPDGVPLIISHPRERPPSAAEITATKKAEAQAEANKDWLLRSYEQQLQLRSSKQSSDENTNLYYRIASDKNLSRLAGMSTIDTTSEDAAAALRTGANNSDKTMLTLRPDPSPGLKVNPGPTSFLAPTQLITPLSAPDAAGLHNFYATIPAAAATTGPVKQTNSPTDTTRISPDLDMPGKVAAENDPLSRDTLTFDTLPDEALPTKGPAQNQVSDGELPLATNAAQLQKLNDAALLPPGTVKKMETTTKLTSLQLKFANELPPIVKLTSPSPVRQPIANPYSILDR